jgi:hypothetical protein
MKRSEAVRQGLPVRDIWRSMETAGVQPRITGISPAVLKQTGLTVSDILESMTRLRVKQRGVSELGLEINPNGGVIALTHPLGFTRARLMPRSCPSCIGAIRGTESLVCVSVPAWERRQLLKYSPCRHCRL